MKTKISKSQIEKFKSMLNGSIMALSPNLQPDDPLVFIDDQLRLIAGVLGSEGTGREVEAYLHLERIKWKSDSRRKSFLDNLLRVVIREIELLEFYPKDTKLQTDFPLPSHVVVSNLDSGKSDRSIPREEFIRMLEAIPDSSIFKK